MRILLCWAILIFMTRGSLADSVRLKCWIVSDATNSGGYTAEAITNIVNGVNEIYAQVCVKFEIDSISSTNDAYLANVHFTNSTQLVSLTSIDNNTGMLELYFVPILDGGVTAFHSRRGIVVGPAANVRTLSHEIGHACGLRDIYDTHQGTNHSVSGYPTKDRMPDDWGWYPTNVTQKMVIGRLLMYGYYSPQKADLSYGDVFGLYYTNSRYRVAGKWKVIKVWESGMAPVGFGKHGNRYPSSK